ncbi:uncharacterized protein N7496_006094 [Penicillium cataractarum]|uniref:Uncharacterized protein n=1 Tax=Penicillium cataractarum TaxID=2100454 RepID=A0A9W9V608_9EURO|nr:uncharacterized protein N7496_006066 [Penicillium cataractarum]XP_056554436.1 uncharacterized protein N7496_006094 [Penicillium cataractarum]KAJ5369974.1 hypothetical protein N7496_006066 [Penicillium cataractarum]KAJ5370002.1 hypothetical protein N7496_006094 [Penicillium cataractarum]
MSQSKNEPPSCSQEEFVDQPPLNPSEQFKCETKNNEPSEEDTCAGRQKAFPLSITLSYVKDWDTTDAFRELYQNWKDAILEQFDVDRLAFQPLYEDREDCVSIIVPDVSNRQERCRALGFIRYDKKTGRTILVNPCAQLKPEALELGHSSKRENPNLIGCHGEGLKLAALVMSRNGYRVKIATANSHWSFSFVGSRFRCMIKPSKMVESGPETDPTEDMARMHSHIERDVVVMVEPAKGKHGKKISLADFQTWVEVTLDIRGISYPSQVIETDVGDLILDPHFCGRIYLQGMLLPATSSRLKPYKLGYNFTQGRVNRDRQILVDKHEEANAVRQIWESAIQKNEKVVLPVYVDFLRNFPEAPDVESADVLLGDATKTLIWRRLLCDTGGKQFYYSEKSPSQVSATNHSMILFTFL